MLCISTGFEMPNISKTDGLLIWSTWTLSSKNYGCYRLLERVLYMVCIKRIKKRFGKLIYFVSCYNTSKLFKVRPWSVDTLFSAAFPRLEGPLVGGFQKIRTGTRASFFDGTYVPMVVFFEGGFHFLEEEIV